MANFHLISELLDKRKITQKDFCEQIQISTTAFRQLYGFIQYIQCRPKRFRILLPRLYLCNHSRSKIYTFDIHLWPPSW